MSEHQLIIIWNIFSRSCWLFSFILFNSGYWFWFAL